MKIKLRSDKKERNRLRKKRKGLYCQEKKTACILSGGVSILFSGRRTALLHPTCTKQGGVAAEFMVLPCFLSLFTEKMLDRTRNYDILISTCDMRL